MAQTFYATRISQHLAETPEGYLLCRAVPLARSAERTPQMYRGSEVGQNTDDVVPVFRSRDAIFDKRFLASLESKPVTDKHPGSFVTNENYGWHSRGHVRNVRPGGQIENGEYVVVGDIIIHDRHLAEKILSGQQREISLGYQYDTVIDADGNMWQEKLVGNHCAVVPNARGGREIRIMDSKGTTMTDEERETLTGIASGIEKLLAKQSAPEEESDPEEEQEFEGSADSRALDGLRALRPVIERSGDRKAINSYNTAVRAVKARIRTNAMVVDNAVRRSFGAGREEVDFFEAASQFHRQNPNDVQVSSSKRDPAGRVQDSSQGNRDWFEAHREAGRKMRAKKW